MYADGSPFLCGRRGTSYPYPFADAARHAARAIPVFDDVEIEFGAVPLFEFGFRGCWGFGGGCYGGGGRWSGRGLRGGALGGAGGRGGRCCRVGGARRFFGRIGFGRVFAARGKKYAESEDSTGLGSANGHAREGTQNSFGCEVYSCWFSVVSPSSARMSVGRGDTMEKAGTWASPPQVMVDAWRAWRLRSFIGGPP